MTAIDLILTNDEKRLMQVINRTNTNPVAAWSRSEVREIAEIGLSMIRYVRKLTQEKEKPN